MRARPSDPISILPSSMFFNGTLRRASFSRSTPSRASIRYASSASSRTTAAARSNSSVQLAPLKSYRVAISLLAMFTALSTSCRSTPVVMSNEAFLAILLSPFYGPGGRRFRATPRSAVSSTSSSSLQETRHPSGTRSSCMTFTSETAPLMRAVVR